MEGVGGKGQGWREKGEREKLYNYILIKNIKNQFQKSMK